MEQSEYVRGAYNATTPFYKWHKIDHSPSTFGVILTMCGLTFHKNAERTHNKEVKGDRCTTKVCQ